VDARGGIFQIRPHKDFVAIKGRDRLLSLRLLSELPSTDIDEGTFTDIGSNASEARNAYNFMRKRRELIGDPLMRRWNALIRLSNFASVESSPLCVRTLPCFSVGFNYESVQMASIGALLDHLAHERAVTELEDDGIGGLEVRDIEILPLYVNSFLKCQSLAHLFAIV
jgi:DNA mismatch repair protein MSH5